MTRRSPRSKIPSTTFSRTRDASKILATYAAMESDVTSHEAGSPLLSAKRRGRRIGIRPSSSSSSRADWTESTHARKDGSRLASLYEFSCIAKIANLCEARGPRALAESRRLTRLAYLPPPHITTTLATFETSRSTSTIASSSGPPRSMMLPPILTTHKAPASTEEGSRVLSQERGGVHPRSAVPDRSGCSPATSGRTSLSF